MTAKEIFYAKISSEQNKASFFGITLKEFFNGLSEKPKNFLVLKGFSPDCRFDERLYIPYVGGTQMESYIESLTASDEPLCLLDFEHVFYLNEMSKDELPQLLALGDTLTLEGDFVQKHVRNKFVYIKPPADRFSELHLKNADDFWEIIEAKLLSGLKGRKKSIPPIPPDVAEQLTEIFRRGAIIDWEKKYSTGIKLYVTGEADTPETLAERLEKGRLSLRCVHLNLDNKTKNWKIV